MGERVVAGAVTGGSLTGIAIIALARSIRRRQVEISVRAVAVTLSLLAATACGEAAPPSPTPTPAPGPSTASAAGAMTGFLAAARAQDNSRVATWLATPSEVAALNELVTVYRSFGSGPSGGGPYWSVAKLTIVGVTPGVAGHAAVALTGDITWCLGRSQNDSAAVCSALNGRPATAHVYAVAQVEGRWKVDIDINNSTQLDHNPEASPTAGAPAATPTP